MKKEYTVKRTAKGKTQTRNTKPVKKIIYCTLLLGGTMFLTWSGIQDLQTTAQLRLNIQQNQQDLLDLEDEKKDLEKTYNNLSNPDYARYYAMGRYHVTQDGEQVFIFPSTEDNSQDSE